MLDTNFFTKALELEESWFVSEVTFNNDKEQLEVMVDFKPGSRFPCPRCGHPDCEVYDTVKKSWRHMNFFQFPTYISARIPRVKCPDCGKVTQIKVPWARERSGFSVYFESFAVGLAQVLPVATVARILEETDTRLWRVLAHYVDSSVAKLDLSGVTQVGVDETSFRKGHQYVTLFVDLDTSRVLFATEGKGADTINRFREFFEKHGGDRHQIRDFSCDMSKAFIKGIGESFPEATITFDRFHVIKLIQEAVDQVRRDEQKGIPALKQTRHLWLKNPENWTQKQLAKLASLDIKSICPKTARAYQIKVTFQDLMLASAEDAEALLTKWYFWATHSRLKPIIRVAKTLKKHWFGIVSWFKTRISNGVLEGINSLVQAAKAKARGFRTMRNMVTACYLVAGHLEFDLPRVIRVNPH